MMDDPSAFMIGHIIRVRDKDYKLLSHLGKGGYGDVYKAKEIFSRDEFAIKIISKQKLKQHNRDKMADRVWKEIECQMLLNHPYILKLFDYYSDANFFYLVLEYCEKGDLLKCIKDNPLSEDTARRYFRQVVEGMICLHEKGILHRDLKPANLLLTRDDNIKIADFGLATLRAEDEVELMGTVCGTQNFVSPEVINQKPYGFEADVWSLGCVLYTMVIKKPYFNVHNRTKAVEEYVAKELNNSSHLSYELKNLLLELLRYDKNQRIKIQDILDHPFMSETKSVKFNAYKSDSGMCSLGTSGSTVSNKRSFDVNVRDRSQKTDRLYQSDEVYQQPIVGKQPLKSATNIGKKSQSINALKEKLQVLPARPADINFTGAEFEDASKDLCNIFHKNMNMGKENFGLQANNGCCHSCQPSLHNKDRIATSEKCESIRTCRSVSPHNSQGTCDSGITDRHCCNRNRESHPENEPCQGCNHSGSCDDQRINSACHHHTALPACSPRGSREELNQCSRAQQEPSCSHYGHCDIVRCVHSDLCGCKKASHVNHSTCPSECRYRHQAPHSNRCENSNQLTSHGHPHHVIKSSLALPSAIENSSISSPNAFDSNIQTNKPPKLDARNLKFKRRVFPCFVASILNSGQVCVEYFKKKYSSSYVEVMCLISPDGRIIKYYSPGHRNFPLKDMPPSIPETHSHKEYTYEELPSNLWNTYNRAFKLVKTIRANTPRIIYYTPKAKAVLMESLEHFEVIFRAEDGSLKGKFQKQLHKLYFIDSDGRTTEMGSDKNITDFGKDITSLKKHALECEKDCRILSDVLQKTQLNHYPFPATFGRRPVKNARVLRDSNKENIPQSSVGPLSSSNVRVYSNSDTNHMDRLNSRNMLSQGNNSHRSTSRNSYRKAEVEVTKYQNVNSHTSSNVAMNTRICGHYTGDFQQLTDGSCVAKFDDGTKMIFPHESAYFVFSDQNGRERRYERNSFLPTHITKKMEDIRKATEKFLPKNEMQYSRVF